MEKILVDVWGSSMTMVDFYKIVRETPKGIVVQRVESTNVGDESVMPNIDKVFGKTYLLKKKSDLSGTFYAGTLDFGKKHFLYKFDGKPKKYNHYD